MKKVFCMLLFFLFVPLIASAQVKKESKTKEPATKLEAFLAKKGRLIVKEFYYLGIVYGKYGSKIKFNGIVVYEPGQKNRKMRGLQIKIIEGGKYDKSDISFLDIEEVESLSTAIKYLIDVSKKWYGINKEYTEVIFSTKDNFEIGFFQKGSNQMAFASSGYIGKVSCFFESMEDLNTIKSIVDDGLKILRKK